MYLVDSSSLPPVLWTRDNNSATSVSAVTIPKRTQANPSLPSPEYTDQLNKKTSHKIFIYLAHLTKMQRQLNEAVAQYVCLIDSNLVLPDQWPIAGQMISTVVARIEQHQVLPSHRFRHILVKADWLLVLSVFLYNQLLLAKFPRKNQMKEVTNVSIFTLLIN